LDSDRFEKAILSLVNLFREGFYKNPNQFDIDVFAKFMDILPQVMIITSRLEEDIVEFDSMSKYFFEYAKERKEISETEIKKYSLTLPKLMLDLSDFHIYTRIFLDTLTVCIKRSFKSAGNEKWDIMEHSINCLLNKDKLQKYKREIDLDFFKNLKKQKINYYWIK